MAMGIPVRMTIAAEHLPLDGFRTAARDRWAASLTGGDMNTATPVTDCFRKLEGQIRSRWKEAPQGWNNSAMATSYGVCGPSQ